MFDTVVFDESVPLDASPMVRLRLTSVVGVELRVLCLFIEFAMVCRSFVSVVVENAVELRSVVFFSEKLPTRDELEPVFCCENVSFLDMIDTFQINVLKSV